MWALLDRIQLGFLSGNHQLCVLYVGTPLHSITLWKVPVEVLKKIYKEPGKEIHWVII
jgi:hypothetical protein